ncbi:hypothetical protein HMPREF9137_0826 [Prevotella denticola F0289]|nr:hypothetical protein HMPREF9137_0826 [Prevotella denticola F0289]
MLTWIRCLQQVARHLDTSNLDLRSDVHSPFHLIFFHHNL